MHAMDGKNIEGIRIDVAWGKALRDQSEGAASARFLYAQPP